MVLFILFLTGLTVTVAKDTTNVTTDNQYENIIKSADYQQRNDVQYNTQNTNEIDKAEKTIKGANEVDVNSYTDLIGQFNRIQQQTQRKHTINLKPGNYNATNNITLEQKNGVKYNITINGNNLELDGKNKYQFIKLINCSLELKDITFKNYVGKDDGGVIGSFNSTSNFNKVIVKNNTGDFNGAIYLKNSNCTIVNSTLTNNKAYIGGVICSQQSNCSILNSVLMNNEARYQSGAIEVYTSNIHIFNSTLTNNTAYVSGAICSHTYSNVSIVNSNITFNTATSIGAIDVDYSSCDIINSSLTNNNAEDAGAIKIFRSNCSFLNSSLINNTAKNDGGAVDINSYSNCSMVNSSLINNNAKRGGAIKIYYYAKCNVINSNLTSNTANDGAAIHMEYYSTVDIRNALLTRNHAQENGGAIFNNSSKINIKNTTFKYNNASNGSDIYNYTVKTKINLKRISQKEYRDSITISGNITDDNNNPIYGWKKISIVVNDLKTNINTTYMGKFSLNIKLNRTGIWKVQVLFEPQDCYLSSNDSTKFNVTKRNTFIETSINDTLLNVPITIKGELTDKTNTKLRNANIYIRINGKEYHVLTDYNGTYTLNYTPAIKGINNITTIYKGNKNYQSSVLTDSFKVLSDVIRINSTYYRDDITIKAVLENNGKLLKNTTVNLTINDETVNVKTDEYGVLNYTCKSKIAGNNILKITYNNKIWTKNFTTKKRSTSLSVNVTKTILGQPINITGKLIDQSNTKLRNANIYIYFNGEKYHLLTDKKGIFSLNITPTTNRSYNKITVVYNGNKNYIGTSLNKTVWIS